MTMTWDDADFEDLISRQEQQQESSRPMSLALELDDFLAGDDDDTYDWVIPGLIEHMDRTMLTGAEGHGKMTLMRQIGITAASGIHPFTLEPIAPVRVTILDLQESEMQLRRELRKLRISAGDRYVSGGLSVASRPEGLDVRGSIDRGYLVDLIMDTKPDIFICGPVYKLADADPTEEVPMKSIASLLDKIRVMSRTAMILEAHQPYGTNGRQRPERPYGWSGWSRWPEFGLCLTDGDMLSHWRGARDQRDWPPAIRRGGPWPFSPVTRPQDLLWAKILDYCTQLGGQQTCRELETLTGASKSSVQRAIKEHQREWNELPK